MSKSKQRKISAYALGKHDAEQKYPFFRWYRHPQMKEYKKGWNDVMKRTTKKTTIFHKLKSLFRKLLP